MALQGLSLATFPSCIQWLQGHVAPPFPAPLSGLSDCLPQFHLPSSVRLSCHRWPMSFLLCKQPAPYLALLPAPGQRALPGVCTGASLSLHNLSRTDRTSPSVPTPQLSVSSPQTFVPAPLGDWINCFPLHAAPSSVIQHKPPALPGNVYVLRRSSGGLDGRSAVI